MEFEPCIHKPETLIQVGERCHSIFHENPSSIPAGYTYLSQFINHDLSFVANRDALATGAPASQEYRNLYTAQFSLESIYSSALIANQPLVCSKTGKIPLSSVKDQVSQTVHYGDLPRHPITKRALIPDKRNDEQLLIAQLHLQFIKLHNYCVDRFLQQGPASNAETLFSLAREETISLYHRIIVQDYLRTMLNRDVWQFYFGSADYLHHPCPVMDVLSEELVFKVFALAVGRFGHAMVRRNYKINNTKQEFLLSELQELTGLGHLLGHEQLPHEMVVDWQRFFCAGAKGLQKSLLICPAINISIPHMAWPENRLAIRDLMRAQSCGLPSGQVLVKTILNKASLPNSILSLLKIIPPEDMDFPVFHQKRPDDYEDLINGYFFDEISDATKFSTDTPIWFYVLRETQQFPQYQEGNRRYNCLGPTSSLILAETYLSAMRRSAKYSSKLKQTSGVETMKQMLELIRGE